MTQKPKKPQKPKIYLSPRESESLKPVRRPWLWVGLLIFGVLATFWKYYTFDEGAARKQQIEAQARIEQLQKQQQSIQTPPPRVPSSKKGG